MAGVSIITAILGFAFVIFIHELGHFLFAKWAGVKVERFSIGMGPIIWSRCIGETEYALSLLPIGGYVKMMGQDDIPGQVVESHDPRSYVNKHAGWKAAILFGGVLFNIVSSYIILLVLAWYGLPVVSPQVGSVRQYVTNQNDELQETPAWKNNLQIGDRVLSINGQKVRSYTDIIMYSMAESTGAVQMELQRQDGTAYTVEMKGVYDKDRGSHTLGIDYPDGLRTRVIASRDGVKTELQLNDRIVGIVGQDEDFDKLDLVAAQLFNRLASHVGREVRLRVERAGELKEVPFTYIGQGSFDLCAPSLGAMVSAGSVLPDSPAAQAGVLPGDYLSAANGQTLLNGVHLIGIVRDAALAKQPVALEVYRYDAESQSYKTQSLSMETKIDSHTGTSIIGVGLSSNLTGPYLRATNPAQAEALTTLGINNGNVIIRWLPAYAEEDSVSKRLGGIDALRVLVVKNGITLKLPYTEAHIKQLHYKKPLTFFDKLFGFEQKKSVWERLGGSRVRKAADELENRLTVEIINEKDAAVGEQYEIDLTQFSKVQRDVFFQLAEGDFIVASDAVTAANEPAFMVVRGAERSDLAWHRVPITNYGSVLATMREELPYTLESWTEAFSIANDMCKQMIVTTLGIIPRFFKSPEQGGIDPAKSLSGPIGIFTGMKQTTEYFGFASFLKMVAFIGINLFLVNLLPIPVVDGGQLVFLAIEVIIRRPVPPKVIEVASYVGLLLIVSLMIFALGIDIERHFL